MVEEQRMTITLTHKQNGSCCSDEVGTSEAAFPSTFLNYSYPYTFLLPLQFFKLYSPLGLSRLILFLAANCLVFVLAGEERGCNMISLV